MATRTITPSLDDLPVADADRVVELDRSREADRWRYTCPYGHTDWDRTNNHAWCPGCRRAAESGHDIDPEHYQILDKREKELIPWEQVILK